MMSLSQIVDQHGPRLGMESCTPPGWTAPLHVREMTGTERDEFDAWAAARPKRADGAMDTRGIRAELISRCLCDEHGTLLVQSQEDRHLLDGLPATTLQRLMDVAQRLNGLGGDAEGLAGN